MIIYAAVVREGGMSHAARALGLSKSHVSKQIAKLEQRLAVHLLFRSTRVVRPTDAGEMFYEHCQEILRSVAAAEDALSSSQTEVVGRIRVSVPVTFGRLFLQPAIIAYARRHPHVAIHVDVSDRAVDLVKEGYDLAIRVGPIADPSLTVRRLGATRRVVVGSPMYLSENGTPRTPEQLVEHECLLYENQPDGNRWWFKHEGAKKEVRIHGRFRSNNGELLAALACAGLGLAWLPDFIVRAALDAGELVPVLDSDCHETSAINIVLPSRENVPRKVRELLETIETHLGGGESRG